jgi:hypothetical protein
VALADATDVSGADRLAGFQYAFDCGTGYGPASSVAQATCTAVADPGTTLKARVTDKDGGATEYTAFVPIQNLPPVVTITQPPAQTVVPIGSSVSFAGTFSDAGRADTHTAQWSFDAATQAGIVTESNGSGTVTATRTFGAAGDYTVLLSVTDSSGGVGSDTRDALMVVVDTGTRASTSASGWIPAAVGKVEFDGNAKYTKGAVIASLTVQAPGIAFASTRADWFVVSGRRAQWAGAGTLDGAPVTFVATAGAGPDALRVVLRRPDGSIALDTSPVSPFDLDTAVLTRLGGGSIQIR